MHSDRCNADQNAHQIINVNGRKCISQVVTQFSLIFGICVCVKMAGI